MLAVAAERGMTSVVASICKVMGINALKEDRIGTAMAWGLKSQARLSPVSPVLDAHLIGHQNMLFQDARFTTLLADQLLKKYCAEGTFTAADLLDNLGSCMVVSDRLTFLAKYREFHRLYDRSEFHTAATLLHSLLWSRLAPKYFWVTLLIDALPFLSCSSDQNRLLIGFDDSLKDISMGDFHDLESGDRTDKQTVYFSSSQTYELLHCLQVKYSAL